MILTGQRLSQANNSESSPPGQVYTPPIKATSIRLVILFIFSHCSNRRALSCKMEHAPQLLSLTLLQNRNFILKHSIILLWFLVDF
jgi:hypothetical protein